MELKEKDKVTNKISILLVIPKNSRLYDYYIDGHADKRTMLQQNMLNFCIELLPNHAEKIRKCVFELIPFALFLDANEFKELKENTPPKLNKKNIIFPMQKLVQNDKIDFIRKQETTLGNLSKNFSIWEQYNIYINKKITENKRIAKILP